MMATEIVPLKADWLDSWFDLLQLSFQLKGTPREYFESHYHCDPWANISSIFVAVPHSASSSPPFSLSSPPCLMDMVLSSPCMMGTVRVFHRRTIAPDGSIVRIGGVGEVATSPSFRKQGTASALLGHAAQYIHNNHLVGLLHCSPALRSFYEKLGWKSVPMQEVSWYIPFLSLSPSSFAIPPTVTVMPVTLSEQTHIPALMDIYHKNLGVHRGMFLRDSERYWSEWMMFQCSRLQCSVWLMQDTKGNRGYAITALALPTTAPSGDGALDFPPAILLHELFFDCVNADSALDLTSSLLATVARHYFPGGQPFHMRFWKGFLFSSSPFPSLFPATSTVSPLYQALSLHSTSTYTELSEELGWMTLNNPCDSDQVSETNCNNDNKRNGNENGESAMMVQFDHVLKMDGF
jgi:hypothetical protein